MHHFTAFLAWSQAKNDEFACPEVCFKHLCWCRSCLKRMEVAPTSELSAVLKVLGWNFGDFAIVGVNWLEMCSWPIHHYWFCARFWCVVGCLEAFIAVGLLSVDEPTGGGDGPRAKTVELAARSSGLRARVTNHFYFGCWHVFWRTYGSRPLVWLSSLEGACWRFDPSIGLFKRFCECSGRLTSAAVDRHAVSTVGGFGSEGNAPLHRWQKDLPGQKYVHRDRRCPWRPKLHLSKP
jgi:hypothetical protein